MLIKRKVKDLVKLVINTIMMKTAIIIYFYSLFIFSLNAQDIEKIKNQKVFFVLFDTKDEYMRRVDLSTNKKGETYSYNFYFYNNLENKKKQYGFSFSYWKYWTYDDYDAKINERMVFKLNKSFLRKNKDIIITREFIERIGEDAITELLADGFDHIFLIDKGEIKNKKILLREVRFNFSTIE